MRQNVWGNYMVKEVEEPRDPTAQYVGAERKRLEKRFEGMLNAHAILAMMSMKNRVQDSGGYVALERVTGTLDGKKGSFCLQHCCTFDMGVKTLDIQVIPDSGTEALTGLRGNMQLDLDKKGQHFYIFDFDFS